MYTLLYVFQYTLIIDCILHWITEFESFHTIVLVYYAAESRRFVWQPQVKAIRYARDIVFHRLRGYTSLETYNKMFMVFQQFILVEVNNREVCACSIRINYKVQKYIFSCLCCVCVATYNYEQGNRNLILEYLFISVPICN